MIFCRLSAGSNRFLETFIQSASAFHASPEFVHPPRVVNPADKAIADIL
jgi:hypothetical protein